ncbi:MAG: hypothetical protein ABH814_01110 [bacterium]
MSRDFLLVLILIFFTGLAVGGISLIRPKDLDESLVDSNKEVYLPLDPTLDIDFIKSLY